MKRLFLAVVLSSLLAYCPSLTLPVNAGDWAGLVNTSHYGSINDLIYDRGRNLLFSGGEDGTVRIWRPERRQLLYNLRTSHQPIQRIAVHPHLSRIAVLVGGPLNNFNLSAWDWDEGKRLFSINIRNEPLYLNYSTSGVYLIYSKAEYKSLSVLDPETGRALPYLRRGFGIVSYFVVSRNEKNIMTYQLSGLISYWDIKRGKCLKKVKTLPNLTSIRVAPNNRFIAAAAGQRLVVVDLVTGAVVDQADSPGISKLAFSLQGNAITAVLRTDEGSLIKRWYFNGKSLNEISIDLTLESSVWSSIVYGENNLFLADREGCIASINTSGTFSLISRNILLRVSDLAFYAGTLAVGSPERILTYTSDFFGSSSPGTETSPPEQVSFNNPFSSAVGLEFLEEGKLLIWKKNEEPGMIAILNRESGQIENVFSDFTSPLIQLKVVDQDILTVEKSGLCKILDSRSFISRFEYLSPGMNILIPASGDSLIGGKSSTSTFGSPLLRINQITGETVSVPDSGLFIYDLLYDDRNGRVYSLGVERSGSSSATLLKVRPGTEYEREKILYRHKGEDLSASLAFDSRGNIYTSLGYSSVITLNGGRLLQMEQSKHVPRKLYSAGGKLFSLNRDSSITVWDPASRRLLLDIYIFKDLSWAALTPGGQVFSSLKARDYLTSRF